MLIVFFAVLERSGFVPLQRSQPLYYAFSALISGNLTLITVVVSINQLLLSQELSTPGKLESQIEGGGRGMIDYRQDVEDAAGRIAPVEPLDFLQLLIENTRQESQRIGGMSFRNADEDAYMAINDVISDLTSHMDAVDGLLQESSTSSFEVLSVTLTTNYARQIRHGLEDELSEEVMTSLDNLIARLQQIDIARQYFKSIYFQEELSTLSRRLFYVGIPAEAVAIVMLLGMTSSMSAPQAWIVTVLPVALSICLLPLTLLFAYIIRIVAVTERTAATIPFTTARQER